LRLAWLGKAGAEIAWFCLRVDPQPLELKKLGKVTKTIAAKRNAPFWRQSIACLVAGQRQFSSKLQRQPPWNRRNITQNLPLFLGEFLSSLPTRGPHPPAIRNTVDQSNQSVGLVHGHSLVTIQLPPWVWLLCKVSLSL